VETAMKHILDGEQTSNPTLKRLFTSVRGQSSSIGHSNEAASFARHKLFSLWHYFGAPAVFFTVTPCDECSFWVRLYATAKEHSLPTMEQIQDKDFCLLDLTTRKKLRSKHPGACTLEYQNIVQIVINILIGWNNKTGQGSNGIFGIPLAYADCCEEQARYTLHSHISVWIKDFNTVRNLLFCNDIDTSTKAKMELQKYFGMIAHASLGDLYDYEINSVPSDNRRVKVGNTLVPPKDQDLRHMRHHVHCQDLHGVVGYKMTNSYCRPVGENNPLDVINTSMIVQNNTNVLLGHETTVPGFTKEQNDALAYTYPYDMIKSDNMRPIDCQTHGDSTASTSTIENALKSFNMRHPLIQLRFNVHDCYHRPSCFKKGPECRTELPQKHKEIATIQFEKNNTINWYFSDGSVRKIAPFKYYPKRNIGDQFMNINNDIATTVLACNNNVTSGDKACFFYVTLYQTKHNQKEEAFNYHSICLALSRRIKNKQRLATQNENSEETTEDISPDFCEGLARMLSSLYGHTANNVLSSTMAAKLLLDESRFKFSHKF